jgi:hypothetical protein
MPIQHMLPEPQGPGIDDADEPSGGSLLHWALFVLGAAMRRKLLTVALLLMGLAALIAYYRTTTPLYLVEAKILVQRTPYSSQDDAARSASVLVHRHDNLVNLIKQADLIDESHDAPPVTNTPRLLSRLAAPLGRTSSSDDDPLAGLVARLDRAIDVTYKFDGTITIRVEWPDSQEAYRLAEAAQQNFLEARHLQEITATDEVIAILQGRAATLREQLARTVEEVQREATYGSAARSSKITASASAPRPDPAAARTRAEALVALKSRLDAKERAIADVEDFRRRRLADLMAQLDEKRAMYSDTYPGVVALRQDVESLSRESPQVIGLREDARKLREQLSERLSQERATGSTAPSTSTATRADHPDRALSNVIVEQDERVREARARYASMLDRLSAAQLERDSARAAFKHRYNVTWPAEVPKEPFRPKPLKTFGLGSMAVLLVALLCGAAPDLWSGKIIQRWQIERSLELPVLTELNRK